ncbi:hypothetical protein [Solibacillus isronensis]|uniref:hypothetical protein n=1 Tax=Solibacillus isronensis TaxID=412383 RepID=UPI0009A66FD0|nr:hypothetical protein [Solibacillus isronensis]
MKSTSIEKFREYQKNNKGRRRSQVSPVISSQSDKATHFEIGGNLYEISVGGFTKAITHGILLLVGGLAVFTLLFLAVFFFAQLVKGNL